LTPQERTEASHIKSKHHAIVHYSDQRKNAATDMAYFGAMGYDYCAGIAIFTTKATKIILNAPN
jgi:hypothetical protein